MICPDINISKLKKNDFKEPKHAIAAISRNMYERWNSTSGTKTNIVFTVGN